MSPHSSLGLPRYSSLREQGQLVVLPEVEAPSLEGLSVTLAAPQGFTAEQVQERFLELARAHATERYRYPGERISWGDEVLLDLAGYSRGHLIPFSLRTEVWLAVQPEPLLPGLYEALVGRSPGEGLAVDLTVPESYPIESLRGIPARFVVHIRAARQVTSPDLESPGFLQAFGRGGTLAEAMRGVVRQMEDEAAQLLLLQARQRVLNEVAARTRVEIPAELVDEEIRRCWSATEGRAVNELELDGRMEEESLTSWLEDAGTRAEVEQRLRIGLALGAIREREGLTLTPQRVEKLLRDEAHAAGLTLEAVADALRGEPEQLARIDQVAWHQLAVDHVMSRARIHIEA